MKKKRPFIYFELKILFKLNKKIIIIFFYFTKIRMKKMSSNKYANEEINGKNNENADIERNTTVKIKNMEPMKIFEEEISPQDEYLVESKIQKKMIFLTMFLTFAGLGLIIAGIVRFARTDNPNSSIVFWVAGGICFIPGIYFARKLFLYYFSKNDDKVNRIREIPRW